MLVKKKSHESAKPAPYTEKYRPQLHFSAPQNWLNDPNGLVWHDGVFHLFYQYNPSGNEWGNMHWGHAVSRNLMHWEHRPLALHAEPWGLGFMFSGCAVADLQNSSGFGTSGQVPLIAIYTSCDTQGIQAQSIAYSLDDGDTWAQYESNPVIDNPGIRDFRDPKVFWHEGSDRWVMTLAADDHVEFYTSTNLVNWELVFRFGKHHGSHAGVWECPDLFPLTTESGQTKWALVISVSTEHSERDESVQYFIGDFDGRRFMPQHHDELWIDHGADNYGAVTWDGVPADDGRRIMIGWMSSWRYAKEMPTYPWRGNMTMPREIRLVEGIDGFELAFAPAREVRELRSKSYSVDTAPIDSTGIQELFTSVTGSLLDLDLEFTWGDGEAQSFSVVFSGCSGEEARVHVDVEARLLIVDRMSVGQRVPNPKFANRFEASLRQLDGRFDLRIIKDRASVEVFGDEGRSVISANLFHDTPLDELSIEGTGEIDVGGEVSVLTSIWATNQ